MLLNHFELNPYRALFLGKLHRVGKEIEYDLLVTLLITPNTCQKMHIFRVLDLTNKLHFLGICLRFDYVKNLKHNHSQIKVLLLEFEGFIFKLVQVHYVINEAFCHFLGVLLLLQQELSCLCLLLNAGQKPARGFLNDVLLFGLCNQTMFDVFKISLN